MDAISEHHYHNIAYGKSVENEDGSLSTVKTIIVSIDGVQTLIPTVWDGKVVDDKTATKFAIDSGVTWPSLTGDNAVEELEAFDRDIHTEFTDQTSQEEALQILVTEFGYPEAGTEMSVDGGTLTLGNDTFENGSPVWTYIEEEEPESIMAPPISIRPERRPTEAEQKEAFYLEKDKLEAEEWAKLKNQEPSSIQYASKEFALGGLAVARKGIMTPEGEDMANNKFQIDENEADLNKDGSLSSYEKTRADAVQKATSEDEELGMYHGGMMAPVDPVSGNPIPVGSSAEEVRDDIDINISQGEYVLPADVVKWHGLEKIMMLQEEAKMGLMAMDVTGLIKEAGEETAEEEGVVCPECGGEGCDHCDGTGYHLEEETTPEGEVVEMTSVEVSEEEPEVNETDDYKNSDYSKKTSMFGMVNKPKVAFIV